MFITIQLYFYLKTYQLVCLLFFLIASMKHHLRNFQVFRWILQINGSDDRTLFLQLRDKRPGSNLINARLHVG